MVNATNYDRCGLSEAEVEAGNAMARAARKSRERAEVERAAREMAEVRRCMRRNPSASKDLPAAQARYEAALAKLAGE